MLFIKIVNFNSSYWSLGNNLFAYGIMKLFVFIAICVLQIENTVHYHKGTLSWKDFFFIYQN